MTAPSPDPSPRAAYQSRLAARRETRENADRQHRRLGNLRLLLFLASTGAAYFWWGWWLLVPLVLFVFLVIRQSRVVRSRRLAERGIAYYERALARLDDRWAGTGETGLSYADPTHPYADDLDLFGKGSLFELLSTARTRSGEATLAAWLLAPASREEVLSRQGAVAELRGRLDLREELAVLGEDFRVGVNPAELASWGEAPPIYFSRVRRVVAAALAGTAAVLILLLALTEFVDPRVRIALVLVGLVEAAFALPLVPRVRKVAAAVEHPGHDLALLSGVLRRLEAEQFTSPKLVSLRAELDVQGQPASRRIARLQKLIQMLESRENLFLRMFGPLLLWTTQLAFAIEDWHETSGPAVSRWLSAVGEMEALSALSGYAYEHPEDPFPEIAASGTQFIGQALGHPLLPASACVRNDVSLTAAQSLIIISGSNMSGKSTLLRTVGVNAVLGLAGAPVRAHSLCLSALHVGASIRVTDSLQGGSSRFYAEISRLRDIMRLCERGPTLFLLDELLNGTNSHDRQIGAEAVVRGMLARGGIGIVTTHDLALTSISEGPARNMHFEDHLEGGVMTFDFRIQPGVVRKSNALELMRAVGLDV